MGTQYLIDSNAVIDYLSGKLIPNGMTFMNGVVNAVPKVSVITKIEVLGYNTSPVAYQILTDFMDDSDILELSESVAIQTIELRKQYKIRLPDAIIAATALVHGFELISRNTGDFKNIMGLTVVDPYTPRS
ncbi:MAG: type II toxin-antitoxin system VapC family toxin [Saprospiraceae bacterium]|nr:type II toxin-antitoxin system VapC family toxin [Saprospiraceae bacterium]MDZ4703960.1 type II toxin-antitoxin system VapC family toxin [Saprospiraceae bacterium]